MNSKKLRLILAPLWLSLFLANWSMAQEPLPTTPPPATPEDMAKQMEDLQKNLETYQQLVKRLDTPAFRALLKVSSDKNVQESVLELADRMDWKKLALAQFVLLLGFFIFRSWRQSQANGWAARMWISTYSWIIYIVLAGYLLPRVLLGKPYGRVLHAIYDILTQS
ncbi:MAG: hypothetical protein H6626_06800 [Pseudobdellovibrionaceae bacterium]|nr:hypothetical protein [Bdellovibrionales bacterium]USN48792.1 MAG: hypothetical protein H6626_06800 [Pseudobdellovibrionaceae bacterium]